MATLVKARKPLTLEEHARRWDEVVKQYEHVALDGWQVETDRYGQVIMSPLPEGAHQDRGKLIADWFEFYFPDHKALYEKPVATEIGSRGPDVVLIAPEQREMALSAKALVPAPLVCVEVWSPSNTQEEMDEKRDAYLSAGAKEVWFCDRSNRMVFFDVNGPLEQSKVCPEFPKILDLSQRPISQLQSQKEALQQRANELDHRNRKNENHLLGAYDFLVKTPEDRVQLEKTNPELVAALDQIVSARKGVHREKPPG
jgi:Uma2 family endonuclease